MKKLIHDIHNGKKVKDNLKRYHDVALQTYSEYGALELTFSAYTLLEEIMEERTELAQKEKAVIDEVLQALSQLGRGTASYCEIANGMKQVRKEITSKMDLFTAYTDRLICYEYVLNRMEFKFLPEKELAKKIASYPEDEFMQKLNQYLFGSRDQSIIRDKLRLVIGQIPVRMTTSKLFEKVGEALTLYKEGDCSSLDDFIYMIRTSAMVYEPENYVGEYAEFEKMLQTLEEADYVNMSESDYSKAVEILSDATTLIHEMTDFYYSLQKVVNGIYAMCLIYPYVHEENKLLQACRSVWTCLSIQEYSDEMLMPFEGRIEQNVENIGYLESVLYEIRNSYKAELKELELDTFFENLSLVANLLSDSLFIDLDKVAKEEVATADYVKQCTERLLDELSAKLSQLSRPVKRAVMGQVLEKLPMMFTSPQEVQEYINIHLFSCQDKAEKAVVLMMLDELMQEELEWS